MMFKCLDCGRVFDEKEFSEWIEPHGETMVGCPTCESPDYEEALKCELCGEVFACSELIEGVCESCLDEYKDDPEMCFKVGNRGKDAVMLNSFIAEMFDADLIADIMFRHLKEMSIGKKIDCRRFILSDKSFFAEKLVEEVNGV